MAANVIDTLRLIGKTLVVEYNAKAPSRLKVSEREREREREKQEAKERSMGQSLDRMRSITVEAFVFAPRPVLTSIFP